ncbi:MAG TPA: hypothetical protein PL089_02220 [Ignavibacteria bacterium]|nr:hypothetical protein [Ignavibacteria bacterium]
MRKSTKNFSAFIIISIISFITYGNVFALDYFQKITINPNKSGIIEIRYSAKTSDLGGADVYKTLPFTEAKIRAAFASENNIVQSVNVNNKDKEQTSVLVRIKFTYFGKINTAPAFSNIKLTYYESGDSTSMIYQLPPDNNVPNDLNAVYTFELPAKEITRSSGTVKDNSVVYGLKPEKVKSGISLYANFKQTDKTIASDNSGNNKSGSEKKEDKEEGSCGLFGIELPIILGLGYAFSRKFKKKK